MIANVLRIVSAAGLFMFALTGGNDARAASGTEPSVRGGAAKFDKDNYIVEIRPSGPCAAGKECKADIALRAKGAFHVNDKYPIKFKTQDPAPEGLTYTKALIKKEDGKFAEKEGSLPVSFTAAKAGKAKVGGVFSFSVCSEANCLMEKVDLELDVDVK